MAKSYRPTSSRQQARTLETWRLMLVTPATQVVADFPAIEAVDSMEVIVNRISADNLPESWKAQLAEMHVANRLHDEHALDPQTSRVTSKCSEHLRRHQLTLV